MPNVEPVATAQLLPAQQSAELVQLPPWPWQTLGAPHAPLEQMKEQHSDENVHAVSTPMHVPALPGGRQVPELQVLPVQQVPPVAQEPPCGTHEPALQRNTPPSAGRQRRPLQH